MALKNAFGQLALEHASATGDAHLTSGTKQRYRREFTDPTLAAWDVVTGAGMVVNVTGGNLVVTTGTTANSVTTLTTKAMFTMPFKAQFAFSTSQKIANQEFFVEVIACDANTGVVDETVVAAWRISGTDSTTTTIARVETRNGQAARLQSGNVTVPTQTSQHIYEIVMESDEVQFHAKPIDTTGSKTASITRNSVAPDPERVYKLRYRFLNAATAPASTTTITCGFVTALDYTETLVEITGAQGTSSASGAMAIIGSGGTYSATQNSGSNTTIWNAAGWGGFMVNDIVSAAVTGTTTSSAITPGVVGSIGTYAHTFHVAVTAVSGTSPTMDVSVEESPDNGTTWVRVYDFQRITATGNYYSPMLRATYGTRYRYVRTLAGTTPSFTMALNRIQFSHASELHKQFFDRSIVPNTLNSVSPVWVVDGCYKFQMIVASNAGATTNPQFQLQGSEDGVNFYAIGAPLTAPPSTTVYQVSNDVMPKFARVIVSTAGVAASLNFLSVKALNA